MPHCITGDHQVLTSTGWKAVSEVTHADEVATLVDGRELVYAHPLKVMCFEPFDGTTVRVRGARVDLEVTREHRMLLRDPGCEPRFVLARDMQSLAGKSTFVATARWNAPTTADKQAFEDAWLELFGVCIVAGSPCDDDCRTIIVRDDPRGAGPCMRFTLDGIVKRLGFKRAVTADPDCTAVFVDDVTMAHVRGVSGGGRLPDWAWRLGASQARHLLIGALFGRGHALKGEGGTWKMTTPTDDIADDLMRLSIHAGWTATIDAGVEMTVWTAACDQPVQFSSLGMSEHRFQGEVYCLQVPSEVFMVRRNGRAVWTGNSRDVDAASQASQASPYKVSTITAVATLSTCIDLRVFFDNLPLDGVDERGTYVFVGQGSPKSGVRTRGVRPPRAKSTPHSRTRVPRFFDHQVTVVYRSGTDEVHNIKVFHNGNVQMTGVKTLEGGRRAVEHLADTVARIATDFPDVLPLGMETAPPVAANFRACLINSDFRAGFVLRRDVLCKLLSGPAYELRCVFETYYPGVKVQFMWNATGGGGKHDGVCRCVAPCGGHGDGLSSGGCRKITISVFQSGCCIITGAHTYEQLDDAYAFITRTLARHRAELERPACKGA